MFTRWQLAAVGVAVVVAGTFVYHGAHAQRPEKGKAAAQQLDEVYYGVANCANAGCHGGSPPKAWVKDPDTGKQLDLLCRCIEADIWSKNDKHADAYNVLTRARGKQMAKILGYDVTTAPQCLACHAVVIKDEAVRKASVAAGFDVKEGVNCVVCHGPHVEWIGAHGLLITASRFRPLSRKVKEEQFGMYDLWDPVRRTELCSSCHIGNAEQGKFISHEMYAAGHPPLPGFEVATFSNEMPRHWQYLREKTPALQKELGLRKDEQEQASLTLIGAVIAFRDSMRLLRDQAAEAIKKKDVLDLSNFDCYACHHDLKKDSWRQQRGYKGKPGRVPMRPWSTELVRLAIDHLAATSKSSDAKALTGELDAGLKKLTQAFDASPTGNNARIEAAAGELATWANTLGQRLNGAYPKPADVKRLLSAIPEKYGRRLVDYDSARQVSWAAEVMYNEQVKGSDGGDPGIRKALKALDAELKLRLPQGRGKVIEDELKENLEKLNSYDPHRFRKLLLSLGSAMK